MLLTPASVLVPPTIPGFFTPRAAPPVVPADSAVVGTVVQTVFVPVPVPATEIIDVPVDPDALAAVRSDARALEPRRGRSTAAFQAPGTTVFARSAEESPVGSAEGRCQTAALRRLRASNVRSSNLRLDGNSTTMRNDGAEVRGSGALLDADRGQWRRFRYLCDDRGPGGETRAVVTFH
jgi:hypothetical protein